MKTKLRALLIIIACIASLSCARQIPVSSVTPENNKTYQVDLLFENDGCKVYRFRDNGNYVYFTNCKGEVTSFSSDSTKIHSINTIGNKSEK
jgi:hypothetical protein